MSASILSVEKAAERVGLSVRQFRRVYYEKGCGKFFQIGRKFFVLVSDLDNWVNTNRGRPCSNGQKVG